MFTLTNLPTTATIEALRERIRAAFTTMQAQIQTVWNVEHRSDGTHRDVTADSVTTPQLRLSMARGGAPTGAIYVVDASGGSGPFGLPLDVPKGAMYVSIVAAGGGAFALYGIRQDGVQFGDRLYVRRDPRSASNIELQDRVVASVPVNTEIHVPQDVSASYPSFFIAGPCWVELIYTPGAGTANANAWALLQTFSA